MTAAPVPRPPGTVGAEPLYLVQGCNAYGCQGGIRWVPSYAGVRIPVNAARNPDGLVVLDRAPRDGTWSARAYVPGRDRADRPRYDVHWTTCPNPGLYVDVKARADPRAELPPIRQDTQAGRCAKCWSYHPDRFGPGGSPLCPGCMSEAVARWQPALRRAMHVDQ